MTAPNSTAQFVAAHKAEKYEYQAGFGNHFVSEAVPGALPKGANTPQKCPKGLYAEQLSGTAFTCPRSTNQRSWLYRLQPSVGHSPLKPMANAPAKTISNFGGCEVNPNQLRWKPMEIPTTPTDFVQGVTTYCGAGEPSMKSGLSISIYACNTSMLDKSLYNSDGDYLFIPQQGTLDIQTEFGRLTVQPGEIAVVQRGIAFAVAVDGPSRGYLCELFSGHFRLPDLGPIGANGLANPRDFLSPVAFFEDKRVKHLKINKFLGKFFECEQMQSPFNVVAWHGNYVPYKYDLRLFCPVNAVLFDHPDPSIFTVLTAPSGEAGVAACDFVVFPPRWQVQEDTFRPPWYHRNLMSEYMGLIYGSYEAKAGGFVPGGGSLHSCMTPHGPDKATFEKASSEDLVPRRLPDTALAFMLESTYIFTVTPEASAPQALDLDYHKCWAELPVLFDASL